MAQTLPKNALRLFAHYEDPEKLPTLSADLVFAKLLEDGDASDLAWLTSTYPEPRLAAWVDRHGDRLLSHRSRSFWRTLFDLPDTRRESPGDPLWPL